MLNLCYDCWTKVSTARIKKPRAQEVRNSNCHSGILHTTPGYISDRRKSYVPSRTLRKEFKQVHQRCPTFLPQFILFPRGLRAMAFSLVTIVRLALLGMSTVIPFVVRREITDMLQPLLPFAQSLCWAPLRTSLV